MCNLDFLNKKDMYKEVKSLRIEDKNKLCANIREFLIDSVSKTGGHLSSNLGVVELTVSLATIFNFDDDKIIWDVGHQTYPYKILTNRAKDFNSLRQLNGLCGFPKPSESKFDCFGTGHSGTSISAAIGMARARDLLHQHHNIVAVIGDGALTGGMAMEALNDISYLNSKLTIVLNDNGMSISDNVGGLSIALSNVNTEDTNIFKEWGFEYLGPIDGHDIVEMEKAFNISKNNKKPTIVHIKTIKGKGYGYAEKNSTEYHGVPIFSSDKGLCKNVGNSYSVSFGESMVQVAKHNKSVIGITAAMGDSVGLKEFKNSYPDRFFDTGIAEQHAVTFASGAALAGLKPVIPIYSTFLQRAYDQIIHDVCIPNAPVVFAIDRAGIVGEDGETHQGVFDISSLNCIPNMNILAPKCIEEMDIMLKYALELNRPVAIRYPRGGDIVKLPPSKKISIGKWEYIKKCNKPDIVIVAVGKMVQHAFESLKLLDDVVTNTVDIINAYSIKPLDMHAIESLSSKDVKVITIEDGIIKGGFGESVLCELHKNNHSNNVYNLGYKDEFIPHGDINSLYDNSGLSIKKIAYLINNISKESILTTSRKNKSYTV